jgi:hypothetical protein
LIVRIADHQRDAPFRAAQAYGIADIGRLVDRLGVSRPCRPDRRQTGQKQCAQYNFFEIVHDVLLQQTCSRDWLQAD